MNCIICDNDFEPIKSIQRYCSRSCYMKSKNDRLYAKRLKRLPYKHTCRTCKIEFQSAHWLSNFCCKKCKYDSQRKFLDIPDCLENASRKLDKNLGYVRIYVPMHPEANTRGYVYEHRVLAEQKIGRRLLPNEVVHHKNGKRWDNRDENLEVMDKIDHAKLHGQREEDRDI